MGHFKPANVNTTMYLSFWTGNKWYNHAMPWFIERKNGYLKRIKWVNFNEKEKPPDIGWLKNEIKSWFLIHPFHCKLWCTNSLRSTRSMRPSYLCNVPEASSQFCWGKYVLYFVLLLVVENSSKRMRSITLNSLAINILETVVPILDYENA